MSSTTVSYTIVVAPSKPEISVRPSTTPGKIDIIAKIPTGYQYVTGVTLHAFGRNIPMTKVSDDTWQVTTTPLAGLQILKVDASYNIRGTVGKVSNSVKYTFSSLTSTISPTPTSTVSTTTTTTTTVPTTKPPTTTTKPTTTRPITVPPTIVTVPKIVKVPVTKVVTVPTTKIVKVPQIETTTVSTTVSTTVPVPVTRVPSTKSLLELLAPRLLEVVETVEKKSLIWTPFPRLEFLSKSHSS